MTTLPEQLRAEVAQRIVTGRPWPASSLMIEASDEIERLHALTEGDPTSIYAETADLRAWKESAMSVLAEWDRVHDALGRPGPLGRSLALNTLAEVERLSAENERLREACFEASLRLHGSLARHRDLDLDLVSYQYVTSASSLLNVALDHSGTLDDQTERWLERAKADAQPGPKHAATDLMAELEASIARVRADRAGRAAPSPSTGEDGGK